MIDDLVRHTDDLMYQAKLRDASVQLGVALKGDHPPHECMGSRGVRAQIWNSPAANDRRVHPETFLHPAVPR